MILVMIRARSYFALLFSCFLFLMILVGCKSTDFPRPTREFYVNDFAHALTEATKHNIVQKGETLYDLTKDYEGNGGAQIVFITILVESVTQIAEYKIKKSEIFTQYKIGKNDMGLLVLLFFMEENEELNYIGLLTDSGWQMKIYLPSSKQGQIADSTIESNPDLEMGIAHFLHELLKVICLEAYDFEEFDDFDEEGYQEYFDTYVPDDSYDDLSMGLLIYLLSPYSSIEDKLWILIPFILSILLGGGFVINKGGGGISSGAGIFRRRR